jgi:putative ABC transport system permease protein
MGQAAASVLYGVSAHDPATFAFVTMSVVLVAIAAVWAPAIRAMRVDPVKTLRAE